MNIQMMDLKRQYAEIKDWGPLGWAKPALDIALEGLAVILSQI